MKSISYVVVEPLDIAPTLGRKIRVSSLLKNVVKQDHRAVKRRCASMAGFKSFDNAAITIAGIELALINKRQFSYGIG